MESKSVQSESPAQLLPSRDFIVFPPDPLESLRRHRDDSSIYVSSERRRGLLYACDPFLCSGIVPRRYSNLVNSIRQNRRQQASSELRMMPSSRPYCDVEGLLPKVSIFMGHGRSSYKASLTTAVFFPPILFDLAHFSSS
jgi:hypothetical protein